MTKEFLTDFAERKRQVRHYLSVVMTVEKNAPIGSATRAQSRRLMTLRGGTFLLLYNLIEATLRGAVETIHGEIAQASTPFDRLSGELRLELVRLFKSKADPQAYALKNVPAEFVALALSYDVRCRVASMPRAFAPLARRMASRVTPIIPGPPAALIY
ncbi:MAE_28990/MAE_18760 family HEPN-like nuclease [Mesorhizobium silamurunense]|uniref:MAE_28990/MAE_18760 family HEPN-like nuclease n=1 Tax=Mesorhizobium silamurunense TaxID=499528 RepID=UPI0017848C6B|nr:MAE_28990/MAE_18760 family HEPN-like nuclease [Mesorhizobium silamurunense]